ncbi:LAGLIDADG family homing endonuclease [Aquisalibacillus elongatus]|uniref:LAGLIDADG DNA endonuclease family protein n=1 Tax=Aquisalibacillus elongatus TaxID=485577 RepID=A0A3N5AZL9_9BACI|nr:LAGLIDADG family homing endonuclease [Aquisalibacillus elongatus]RPF50379.1 LAGLIDADG DNA endonuclease family protein [Aquisalibacillus elongatus]
MLKSWEAAYIAGIIDGDGTISLKNTESNPVITITSPDLNMLVYIQSILPGSLSSKKSTILENPTYLYTIEIKQKVSVLQALKQIKPFVQAEHKKAQIDTVLQKSQSKRLLHPKKAKHNLYVLERA